MPWAPGLAGAAGTSTLYLVAIGCSVAPRRDLRRVDPSTSRARATATHVLHVVGVGAARIRTSRPRHMLARPLHDPRLGPAFASLAWLGIAVTAFHMTSGSSTYVYLALVRRRRHRQLPAFPCMGFAASVMLVVALRRGTHYSLQTVHSRPSLHAHSRSRGPPGRRSRHYIVHHPPTTDALPGDSRFSGDRVRAVGYP